MSRERAAKRGWCRRTEFLAGVGAGCQYAFAGKPAPTLDLQRTNIAHTPSANCGSGLAREEALPGATESGSASTSHRRNRRQHADQNSHYQKGTQKNRHLAHKASYTLSFAVHRNPDCGLAVIVRRKLSSLQRQKALKNTDQMLRTAFACGSSRWI